MEPKLFGLQLLQFNNLYWQMLGYNVITFAGNTIYGEI